MFLAPLVRRLHLTFRDLKRSRFGELFRLTFSANVPDNRPGYPPIWGNSCNPRACSRLEPRNSDMKF
jgi:hypothetical protein